MILFLFFINIEIIYHMNEKDKLIEEFKLKDNYDLNLKEFFKELNNAISANNMQSIFRLSKIFNRYYFKKLNN